MVKKNKIKYHAALYFIVLFLYLGFFCISINTAFANSPSAPTPGTADTNISPISGLNLPDSILYLYKFGMFFGFLAVFVSLAIGGAMYAFSPVSAEAKASARDRVSGAISGLLILTLTYLIVTTINSSFKFFNFEKPKDATVTQNIKKDPGVYFYQSECPDNKTQSHLTSVADLGVLKNKVSYVDIVQGSDNSYISILYNNINFWGGCQYVDPNKSCYSVTNSATSASVYKYDFKPSGEGVYFFRKSCFSKQPTNSVKDIVSYCKENSGGYYMVPNFSIKGIYWKKLDDLTFLDVLQEEQKCIKYDKNGDCTQKKPQTLGGENISSLVIDGDYLVLFVYVDPSGKWTSCQEFPVLNDVNKVGPQQIKWENVRNNGGVIPNYIAIFPIINPPH